MSDATLPKWSARCRRASLALIAGLCLLLTACAANGRARVDLAERIDAGDARLYVEVRGQDSGPLLLWLHGGPGGAERPLFRYFNGSLEQDFLVAYLDQRGAG